jgi:hypothetical protein
MPNTQTLLAEVIKPRGCRVSHINDEKALEFVRKVAEAKKAGKDPNLKRASEILEEAWGLDVPRRALSAHIRGECGCQKTK